MSRYQFPVKWRRDNRFLPQKVSKTRRRLSVQMIFFTGILICFLCGLALLRFSMMALFVATANLLSVLFHVLVIALGVLLGFWIADDLHEGNVSRKADKRIIQLLVILLVCLLLILYCSLLMNM